MKITAVSMYRSRADAYIQRSLGLKVGGTMTEFYVSDGVTHLRIYTWGATPGERKTAALEAFKAGGSWRGANAMGRVR